ncbi:hypothetical protein POM88_008862 [Heracleum sosnowskyi]|uniref:F-box associated beta-propeller type 3 domain-containing protein n=1 Tax=Heracleum sosnowskyi TaxID=360622 RepID=A0AAD8J8T2_9APIA|nr:hypothetical protein POM88_008862 [Heracleum sosnowskyi]
MAKKSLAHLPEGMITEIFIRLPVKSLLQCNITTSWNDPTILNIINVHKLAFLTSEPVDHMPGGLEQQQQRRQQQLVNMALGDANRQDLSTSPVQFVRLGMPCLYKYSRFYSCCNGIICFGDMALNAVYLWNPSIRKGKELLPARGGSKSPPLTIGLGYDALSSDYKVPVLKNWMKNIQSNIKPINVFVNGVLYFDGGDELVSFDMHEEVVRLISFPSFIRRRRSNVLDFEGSVAMVFESGTGVDLWTLYNVSDKVSWTKKVSIEYGLDDPDTEIWLSCYLGAKQFFGSKLLNGNYFLYEVLYDSEKIETKFYGLEEDATGNQRSAYID